MNYNNNNPSHPPNVYEYNDQHNKNEPILPSMNDLNRDQNQYYNNPIINSGYNPEINNNAHPNNYYATEHNMFASNNPYVNNNQPNMNSNNIQTNNQYTPPVVSSTVPNNNTGNVYYGQTTPNPGDINHLSKTLKSNSQLIKCPYCGNLGMTRTDREFSMGSCCCCYCTGLLVWFIFQLCREKDANCYDAEHYCASCGNRLNSYKSC